MKKFIQTLKNIWSIEELRSKILFTLMLDCYLPCRFTYCSARYRSQINSAAQQKCKAAVFLDLIDAFAGGAFSQASIFALGIMPYISASIFMQLMTILVPQMQKMQKEGDSGRKKINQWTRYLTVIVTAVPGSCLCCLPEQSR